LSLSTASLGPASSYSVCRLLSKKRNGSLRSDPFELPEPSQPDLSLVSAHLIRAAISFDLLSIFSDFERSRRVSYSPTTTRSQRHSQYIFTYMHTRWRTDYSSIISRRPAKHLNPLSRTTLSHGLDQLGEIHRLCLVIDRDSSSDAISNTGLVLR
jgi:hypothetical protein